MNQDIQQVTETMVMAGFSENESAVFLALLELGKGSVTQITRKAGLNRTTGYDILDTLVSKGLVGVSGKEPKQEYLAESPERVISLLERQLEEKRSQLEKVRSVLPELKSLHNVAGRPKVRFYEGIEGLKDIYEDTLTSTEPIRAYASVGDMHLGLPGYFPGYY